jgi:hypothetical protein
MLFAGMEITFLVIGFQLTLLKTVVTLSAAKSLITKSVEFLQSQAPSERQSVVKEPMLSVSYHQLHLYWSLP